MIRLWGSLFFDTNFRVTWKWQIGGIFCTDLGMCSSIFLSAQIVDLQEGMYTASSTGMEAECQV